MPLKITRPKGDMLAALSQATAMARRAVLEAAGDTARGVWVNLAQKNLKATRRSYAMGIQPVQISGNTVSVTLVGRLPNMVENGMPQVDMHDTLLGPNVPVTERGKAKGKHLIKHGPKAGGFYRSIPFRHATPGASDGAVGAEMGSAYREAPNVDWRALGAKIYGAAKDLAGTTGKPYSKRGVRYGDRLPAGLAPKLKDHHATDIYAGMIRNQKTYKGATQSSYMTFRTISTGSPGWVRKAVPGVHFAKQVKAYMDAQLPHIIAQVLSGFKGGT